MVAISGRRPCKTDDVHDPVPNSIGGVVASAISALDKQLVNLLLVCLQQHRAAVGAGEVDCMSAGDNGGGARTTCRVLGASTSISGRFSRMTIGAPNLPTGQPNSLLRLH